MGDSRPASGAPKIFEPLLAQFRIPSSVLNGAMAEPILNRSRVVARISQRVAACMPQHVDVTLKGRRPSNSELRPREYLTPSEVETPSPMSGEVTCGVSGLLFSQSTATRAFQGGLVYCVRALSLARTL